MNGLATVAALPCLMVGCGLKDNTHVLGASEEPASKEYLSDTVAQPPESTDVDGKPLQWHDHFMIPPSGFKFSGLGVPPADHLSVGLWGNSGEETPHLVLADLDPLQGVRWTSTIKNAGVYRIAHALEGGTVWAGAYYESGEGGDFCFGERCWSTGDRSSAARTETYVLRFSASGAPSWARRFKNLRWPQTLTANAAGLLFVVGPLAGTLEVMDDEDKPVRPERDTDALSPNDTLLAVMDDLGHLVRVTRCPGTWGCVVGADASTQEGYFLAYVREADPGSHGDSVLQVERRDNQGEIVWKFNAARASVSSGAPDVGFVQGDATGITLVGALRGEATFGIESVPATPGTPDTLTPDTLFVARFNTNGSLVRIHTTEGGFPLFAMEAVNDAVGVAVGGWSLTAGLPFTEARVPGMDWMHSGHRFESFGYIAQFAEGAALSWSRPFPHGGGIVTGLGAFGNGPLVAMSSIDDPEVNGIHVPLGPGQEQPKNYLVLLDPYTVR